MKKRNAFTLAEVLITLGIIGIVAAMTLPTLVQQNQKKVVATRLKQTYNLLYQAINMAQADYGDMKNWEVNDNYQSSQDPNNPNLGVDLATAFAEKYITPYLKHTGTPRQMYLKDLGYNDYYTKDGRVYLASRALRYVVELTNGVTLIISYNGGQNSEGDPIFSLPLVFVDINGKTKPNIVGRDFFMFDLDSIYTMKVRPSGYGRKRDELLKLCQTNASGNIYDNLACTALIFNDNWEIKDDYPW